MVENETVPPEPVYAAICTVAKFSTARTGMLSRINLTSRASIIPVTARLVTVLLLPPAVAKAVVKLPAVGTFTVMDTCATANIVNSAKDKDNRSFFI